MAYQPGDYLFNVIMTTQSGLVEDEVVNTFAAHFLTNDPEYGDIEAAAEAIGTYYTGGAAAVNRVGNYLSPWIDRGATHRITGTRIVSGPLGSPVYDEPWIGPPTPTVDDALPEECAAVLSIHANLSGVAEESGAARPRARRRGRIFIGPLTLEAVDYDVFPVRLKTTFRTALQARAVQLSMDLEALGWNWSVWSRADVTLRPVVGGWTDNAPDTQRRRGPASTNRSTWSY